MYSKSSKITTNKQNLSNYIDGIDVYNSIILGLLNDPSIEREEYEITVYEYRPDLIAEEYYGSTDYMGLLILTCSIGLESYTRGTTLKLIPKTVLDRILQII